MKAQQIISSWCLHYIQPKKIPCIQKIEISSTQNVKHLLQIDESSI